MKGIYFLLTALLFATGLCAQTPFKIIPEAARVPANVQPDRLEFRTDLIPRSTTSHPRPRQFDPNQVTPLRVVGVPGVKPVRDAATQQVIALRGRPEGLTNGGPTKEDAAAYLAAVGRLLRLDKPTQELVITAEIRDELGQTHLRLQQQYQGIEIYPAEARLHAADDTGFNFFTGRLVPTPTDLNVTPVLTEDAARTQVQRTLSEQWIDLPATHLKWLSGPQLETKLVIYAPDGTTPVLAWKVDARPNLLTHDIFFLDAQTGAVINQHSHLCGFANKGKTRKSSNEGSPSCVHHNQPDGQPANATPPPPDGPYTTTLPNLYDQNQTINTFSIDDTYLLLDGSRDMFTNNNGEIDGLIITYDGLSNTPQRDDFDPVLSTSLNNTDWTPTAVSVHANAGAAYQYFLDRHGRNSIDGNGGSVYSFMNINETDGTEMDNAFWNGRALFYGNGLDAFNRLPRGLDVAGHEMAHGVIQSTANLVYENQPGALNESFADIFGYLVEGETGDYRIGEDVVRTNVFTSGAMRNLQNPNNGASGPSDFRWQPAHMDEFQNLPNTQQGDNGGVHINSGIPNRAFYLFSSHPAVGDTRAERVYYRALSQYLTRSSQFLDLRIAVVQAAGDLYGADVVAAANAAFNGVGIGDDGTTPEDGGDYTVDLETNDGDRFLLLSNVDQSALFRADENGQLIDNPLLEVGLLSRPSITDDGAAAAFIDDQNRIRVYNFITEQLSFLEETPQEIWRNVAVSKDGTKLALLTTDNDNRVLIYDFITQGERFYDFFNPTTANTGIATGDVQYADILEWAPGGEFLMYDALSQLDDGLEFWDIGFLNVWDNAANNFASGNILKLINDLPSGISVGNPTFSKNSPYILAYEEVDFATGTFSLVGANIETGNSSVIFQNGQVNYPNYDVDDASIVFDGVVTGNDRVLAIRSLEADKITGTGQATVIVNGGHWGIFYANGERDLNTSLDGPLVDDNRVKVYPTVTAGLITVETPGELTQGSIQVFNAQGQLVRTWAQPQVTIPAQGGVRSEVDLAGLASGSYFLAVPVNGGVVVRRVMVR